MVHLSVSNLRVTATAEPVATSQTPSSSVATGYTSPTSVAGVVVPVVHAVVNAPMVPVPEIRYTS